jgi:hypothetical protein
VPKTVLTALKIQLTVLGMPTRALEMKWDGVASTRYDANSGGDGVAAPEMLTIPLRWC